MIADNHYVDGVVIVFVNISLFLFRGCCDSDKSSINDSRDTRKAKGAPVIQLRCLSLFSIWPFYEFVADTTQSIYKDLILTVNSLSIMVKIEACTAKGILIEKYP